MPIVTEKNQKYVETDFSIAQLTEEELKEIRSYYFYSIEDVKPLNKSQQWVLDNKSFLSPNCCHQVLFKLKGIIDIKIIKDKMVSKQNFLNDFIIQFFKIQIKSRMI